MHASKQDKDGTSRRRTRAQGERRHPRSITATNSEWQRVAARADKAGMPIGRYLIDRALAPEPDNEAVAANALPNDLEWELAERLLVTAAVIEARLAGTAWEAEMNSIKARVRQKLDLARLLR